MIAAYLEIRDGKIARLQREEHMTILLISHDYKLVHRYAHRVILLKEGRIDRIGKISINPTEENKHETRSAGDLLASDLGHLGSPAADYV